MNRPPPIHLPIGRTQDRPYRTHGSELMALWKCAVMKGFDDAEHVVYRQQVEHGFQIRYMLTDFRTNVRGG